MLILLIVSIFAIFAIVIVYYIDTGIQSMCISKLW